MNPQILLYAGSMVFGALVIVMGLAVTTGRVLQRVDGIGRQVRGVSKTVHKHSLQLARLEVKAKLRPLPDDDEEGDDQEDEEATG